MEGNTAQDWHGAPPRYSPRYGITSLYNIEYKFFHYSYPLWHLWYFRLKKEFFGQKFDRRLAIFNSKRYHYVNMAR